MTIRQAVGNSNRLIGVVMLIFILVLIGPNTLPRILKRVIPNSVLLADEGVACGSLRAAKPRAQHQSLIGRQSEDPIGLSVQADYEGDNLLIRITIANQSIGAVPIVYDEDEVIIGDNQTTGLGILFTPPVTVTAGARAGTAGSYDERKIRILGPRQRCVHRQVIPLSTVGNAFAAANPVAQAYYRVTSPGTTGTTANTSRVFSDQGIHVKDGIVISEEFEIPSPFQAN